MKDYLKYIILPITIICVSDTNTYKKRLKQRALQNRYDFQSDFIEADKEFSKTHSKSFRLTDVEMEKIIIKTKR